MRKTIIFKDLGQRLFFYSFTMSVPHESLKVIYNLNAGYQIIKINGGYLSVLKYNTGHKDNFGREIYAWYGYVHSDPSLNLEEKIRAEMPTQEEIDKLFRERQLSNQV